MTTLRPFARIAAACASIAVVAGAAACTPSSPTKPEATSTPPRQVSLPLTGEKADAAPDHPAVAVKIPADAPARPQTGLAAADNVWVELVEGGEVRYNAVYYSTLPQEVGPVRSIRPVDAPINAPLRGALVTSGGQPDFLRDVGAAVGALVTEDRAGDAAWRVTSRRMPYNLYTSPERVAQAHGDLKAPPRQWDFAANAKPPAGGEAVTDFAVTYPAWRSGWAWSGQAWQRFDNKQASADADGTRIEATTVLVLAVETEPTSYLDPVGAPVIASKLNGSGKAKVAVDGRLIDATWHKDAEGAPITLSDDAGKKLSLPAGKIWIELVPASSTWVTSTPAQPQPSESEEKTK